MYGYFFITCSSNLKAFEIVLSINESQFKKHSFTGVLQSRIHRKAIVIDSPYEDVPDCKLLPCSFTKKSSIADIVFQCILVNSWEYIIIIF